MNPEDLPPECLPLMKRIAELEAHIVKLRAGHNAACKKCRLRKEIAALEIRERKKQRAIEDLLAMNKYGGERVIY